MKTHFYQCNYQNMSVLSGLLVFIVFESKTKGLIVHRILCPIDPSEFFILLFCNISNMCSLLYKKNLK